MKKFIFSALAAIGLLLSPSCSDENEVLSGSDNEALVSFNVNLADGISTKAISDGKTVNRLRVRVFEDDGGSPGDLVSALNQDNIEVADKTATAKMQLVKGKKYHLLFWADYHKEGTTDPYTIDADGKTITVSYDEATCNDENRDAFYYVEKNYVVSETSTSVELKRPFAQLNFMMNKDDIDKAKERGFKFEDENTTVSVKVTGVATEFHPLDGTTSAASEEEVTFAAALIPFGNQVEGGLTVADNITIGSTPYYYLATNYLLAAETTAGTTTNLNQAVLTVASSSNKDIKTTVANVPVKPNYRTNVYGDFLTANGEFTVEINPNYSGEKENIQIQNVPKTVSDEASFALALQDPSCNKIIVTAALQLINKVYTIDRDMTIEGLNDGNGFVGSGNGLMISGSPVVTLSNLNIACKQSIRTENFNGSLTIDKCTFIGSKVEGAGFGAYYDGIELNVDEGANVKIKNNIFECAQNAVEPGGGKEPIVPVSTKTGGAPESAINYISITGTGNQTQADIEISSNTFKGLNSNVEKVITIENMNLSTIMVGSNRFDGTWSDVTGLFVVKKSDGSTLNVNSVKTAFEGESLSALEDITE